MSIEIETGRLGIGWRAAASIEGELIAEARGLTEEEARAALGALLGSSADSGTPGIPETSIGEALVQGGGNALRDGIRSALRNHPAIRLHDQCSAHTAKMDRYRATSGRSIAHEHNLSIQHLWIAADRVTGLEDIPSRFYAGRANGAGRHSNLKAMLDFLSADLLRYSPTDMEQVGRILEVVTKLTKSSDV